MGRCLGPAMICVCYPTREYAFKLVRKRFWSLSGWARADPLLKSEPNFQEVIFGEKCPSVCLERLQPAAYLEQNAFFLRLISAQFANFSGNRVRRFYRIDL